MPAEASLVPPGGDPADALAVAQRLDRPIVLIGMMGVGKTSLGRRLAAALAMPFCDADEEIAAAAALSIPEIFARHGEAYFRAGERRVIARLISEAPEDAARPSKVIATGGGAFCDPDTRDLILRRSLAIWLDAGLDTLVERTGRRATRPLLATGNPREILAQLKAQRDPLYAQAPLHIKSDDGPHQRLVAKAMAAILGWLDAGETP